MYACGKELSDRKLNIREGEGPPPFRLIQLDDLWLRCLLPDICNLLLTVAAGPGS
jgi:hypothetical protein